MNMLRMQLLAFLVVSDYDINECFNVLQLRVSAQPPTVQLLTMRCCTILN